MTSRMWDHPRIRGEHPPHLDVGAGWQGIIPAYAGSTEGNRINGDREIGSSPHTRGAPGTPAYAGSTVERAAHPLCNLGSSPHTRGALS